MKNSYVSLVVCALAGGIFLTASAQNVGINTTGATPNAAAILDLNTGNAGTKGFLPEQVALTNVTVWAPLTGAATVGMLVYSTAAPTGGSGVGYYYWGSNAKWNYLLNAASNNSAAWLITGNAGTNPAINFLGTTDVNALNFRTNNTQWMTILSSGQVGIWNAAPPYVLTVTAAAGAQPVTYIANSVNTGGALWAANTAGSGASTGYGIAAYSLQTGGAGVAGEMGNATVTINTFSAVSGTCDATVAGYGVTGVANNAGGTGVLGMSSGSAGWGTIGLESGAGGGIAAEGYNSGTGVGVFAYNNAASYGSLEAKNVNATGTGAMVSGNNIGLYYPGGVGCGGDFNGATIGLIGDANAQIGYFNNCGVSGMGTVGVEGRGPANYGGYFDDGVWYAWVGGSGSKILGNGIVSTEVLDQNNQYRVLTCPEAPEVLFEDFGTATLSNGKVHVNLDNLYSANVTINAQHPLRVMITLNDQCNGVYVTNRTPTGFDVVELNNGTSNASFTYEVIANRAALHNIDFANMRFSIGRGPQKASTTTEVKQANIVPQTPAAVNVQTPVTK